FPYGLADDTAFLHGRERTPSRHRNDLEPLGSAHEVQWHQSAVFNIEGLYMMRACSHAPARGDLRDRVPERRVTFIPVLEILDKVREFIARKYTLEIFARVEVIARVDEPVCIQDHDGVAANGYQPTTELFESFDCAATAPFERTFPLGDKHRRNVRNFCRQCKHTHGRCQIPPY